jgi:hypothetical protein
VVSIPTVPTQTKFVIVSAPERWVAVSAIGRVAVVPAVGREFST